MNGADELHLFVCLFGVLHRTKSTFQTVPHRQLVFFRYPILCTLPILYIVIGLKQQLSKIDSSSLNTTHSERNLGFIFDENLTFTDNILSLCTSCYSHIREFRCIRPYLDSKTASTIAASIVHSKLDYCNSLYYNLPKSQINRLQQIQNYLAPTVDCG